MITEEELKNEYAMSDEELAGLKKSVEQYESGEWPKGKIIRVGRPSTFDGEPMEPITIRFTRSSLQRIDIAIKEANESRSDFVRRAVEEKLDALANS